MSITSTLYICPTERPSFFPFFSLPPACIIPSFFFLSPSLRYKITYSSNHNFLSRAHTFFFFFLIISNFIFYNCLNSIHKLIYDSQRKDNTYTMSKYLLFLLVFFFFFFFSCLVFGVKLFFSFYFSFFWGPCVFSCLSSFSFLFSGGLVFSVAFLLFLFFFLGALCFLSLLPSPEQAVHDRFLCFLVASLIHVVS